jgi:hypothetical protein
MSNNTEKSWDTLYEKYPELFANRTKTPMESCMSFGVEVGKGWYDIISDLCFMIAQHERNIEGNNKYRISQNKEPVEYYHVKFDQIKEKFGGLRVYFSGEDEYVRGLVGMAEAWSYKTCERCGEKGSPNNKGWITTLCDNCRSKNESNN